MFYYLFQNPPLQARGTRGGRDPVLAVQLGAAPVCTRSTHSTHPRLLLERCIHHMSTTLSTQLPHLQSLTHSHSLTRTRARVAPNAVLRRLQRHLRRRAALPGVGSLRGLQRPREENHRRASRVRLPRPPSAPEGPTGVPRQRRRDGRCRRLVFPKRRVGQSFPPPVLLPCEPQLSALALPFLLRPTCSYS